ncbi:MAG: hypothetical protein ACLRP8_01445 [Roseburia intestinalis]
MSSGKRNGKETERFMWLVTTLEAADYRVLWEMMHRRGTLRRMVSIN